MPADTGSLLTMTSPAGDGALIPTRFAAVETISELFRFEIEAVSEQTIDPLSMLNQPACVWLNNGGQTTRYFHGIVAEFGPTGPKGVLTTPYRIVLAPKLLAMDFVEDCRQFFNKAADDIIKALFADAGVTAFSFKLYGAASPRVVTTQYNETSLHFASRLMEEEGWFYFFEHTADQHTLVVTSANTGFSTVPDATLKFGTTGAAGRTSDLLDAWDTPNVLTTGKVSLTDYDETAPNKDLLVHQPTVLKHGGVGNREAFHWPGLSMSASTIKTLADWRMQAAEADVSLVHAAGSFGALFAGGKFNYQADGGAATPYVVRQVRHAAQDDARRGTTGTESYSNSFSCFPNATPWRQPMRHARPRMEGLHTAVVLAPDGQEIETDDAGHIKIRFRWDWRKDATSDTANWVRVVQPWTGNKWGGQFIPRVDTEVAVAFMDADPDRAVVVGGLYNAINVPIYPKAEKNKTGFRSRSTLKGGTDAFNEFTFDDTKDSELVFLHAQKDLTTEVEHDESHTVDNDRTRVVKGKETITVTKDRTHTISEGNESITVSKGNQTIEVTKGNQSTTIDTGNHALTVSTGNQTVEVSTGDQTTTIKTGNQTTTISMGNQSTDLKMGNVTIKADLGAISIEAMQSITLKVGQNTLTIDQMGVTLKGMMTSVQGTIQTEVKGLMVTTSGDAMLTLKGAITMIN